MARLRADAIRERGNPQVLLTDNGPEFTGRALDQWAYTQGITHQFIDPGKPVQNAYIESFNGRMRDEFLNVHWFLSVPQARLSLAIWRRDYNSVRPHSSLGNLTPREFARQLVGRCTLGSFGLNRPMGERHGDTGNPGVGNRSQCAVCPGELAVLDLSRAGQTQAPLSPVRIDILMPVVIHWVPTEHD